jgi:hypothetical protein
MTKPWTPKRPTVEMRATSKIRREPPPRPSDKPSMLRMPSEDESWPVVIGIVAFALAFTYLIFWVSDYTSPGNGPAPIVVTSGS